jgi:hypothetical protein
MGDEDEDQPENDLVWQKYFLRPLEASHGLKNFPSIYFLVNYVDCWARLGTSLVVQYFVVVSNDHYQTTVSFVDFWIIIDIKLLAIGYVTKK